MVIWRRKRSLPTTLKAARSTLSPLKPAKMQFWSKLTFLRASPWRKTWTVLEKPWWGSTIVASWKCTALSGPHKLNFKLCPSTLRVKLLTSFLHRSTLLPSSTISSRWFTQSNILATTVSCTGTFKLITYLLTKMAVSKLITTLKF